MVFRCSSSPCRFLLWSTALQVSTKTDSGGMRWLVFLYDAINVNTNIMFTCICPLIWSYSFIHFHWSQQTLSWIFKKYNPEKPSSLGLWFHHPDNSCSIWKLLTRCLRDVGEKGCLQAIMSENLEIRSSVQYHCHHPYHYNHHGHHHHGHQNQ